MAEATGRGRAARLVHGALLPVVAGFAAGYLVGLVVPGDNDLSDPLQLGLLTAAAEAMTMVTRWVVRWVMTDW